MTMILVVRKKICFKSMHGGELSFKIFQLEKCTFSTKHCQPWLDCALTPDHSAGLPRQHYWLTSCPIAGRVSVPVLHPAFSRFPAWQVLPAAHRRD